ncbi:uncharacterized protein [Arachis hypogaea]|uniref:uncharacterized protein n=1 Tax=Arachis hypogaea TaxID=3818 RepID=UPI003B21D6EC
MTLAPYKGVGDPKVHVTKFESMMFLNRSITSFDKFAKIFLNHFAASKIYVRDSDYLSIIKQGLHESLKDCMTRFTTAAMEIPNLNPEVQLHAIKSGLQPEKYQEAIAVAKPKTLEEFRDKATGQIEIEDLCETRRKERPSSWKEDDRPSKFNTRKEDIIKEILHNRLIKPPVKAGTYQDQKYVDKSKHYAFHQKFSHTTNECVVAKDLLEILARRRNYQHSQEMKLSGDDDDGGAHQNLPVPISTTLISFKYNYYKSQTPNLDDPVVISVHMGELTIKKVLLDPGSNADVLFYSTFKKMQLSDKALQPSGGELARFSGERVPISNYVWLRTTLGEPPNYKTLDIQFLVVDCVSPYKYHFGASVP